MIPVPNDKVADYIRRKIVVATLLKKALEDVFHDKLVESERTLAEAISVTQDMQKMRGA